jgi:protein TonB
MRAYRHRTYAGMPRSAIAVALVLSLLLHGFVILALFYTERPSAEAAQAIIVTVDLVASQPAAPLPSPAASAPSPQTPSSAAQGEPEEMRKRGTEPPHASEESARPAAITARTASIPNNPDSKARVAMHPMPTVEKPSTTTRFDEAPDNPAYDGPSAYLRLLATHLAEVKQYPTAAAARREEGVVLLAFRLDRSGRVLSWEIARSSGHDELDAEVSRMIALAAPFPPFPVSWRQTSASFQVPIGFSLY